MHKASISLFAAIAMVALPAFATARADHLLISKVLVKAPGLETDDSSAEFIEIYNPTDNDISLDHYYISTYQNYFELPAGNFDYGDRSHFMLKFPTGTFVAANCSVVVTQSASRFLEELGSKFGGTLEAFSAQPTTPKLLEVKETEPSISQMTNLKAGAPRDLNLTFNNTGGFVALFHWDGQTDLVQDVDIMRWGNPDSLNTLLMKTGVSVDGPDADEISSTYAPDNGLTAPYPTNNIIALKRVRADETSEISTGGNGITGHDETTEDLRTVTAPIPVPAVTPGVPDTGLFRTNVSDWYTY